MTKTYRVTPFVRMTNLFTTAVVRSNLRLGKMALLTVTGRKSGVPRTVPVAIMEREGQRYLIGAFGEVNWVRNLRADAFGYAAARQRRRGRAGRSRADLERER